MHGPGHSGTSWICGLLASAVAAVVPVTSAWLVDLPPSSAWALAAGALLCACRPAWRFASGLCVGGLWLASATGAAVAERLPACVVGVDHQVEARVESVRQRGPGLQLHVVTQEDGHGPTHCPVPRERQLRLYWRTPGDVRVGDRWTLVVRVRPPTGYVNPGTFDYERWLLGAGVDGTGYVRAATLSQRGTADWAARYRAEVVDGLAGRPELRYPGVIRALAVGDADGVTDRLWQLFRATGTVHLMVISGLHVGLVATFGALCAYVVLRPWLRATGIAVRTIAVLTGVAVAGFYAWLAGWGAPVQRAWIMITALTVLWCLRRHVAPYVAWCLAVVVLMLGTPLAVFHAGFWLSFGVVLVLLVGPGRVISPLPWWRRLIGVQVLVSLAMLPLLAAWHLPWATSGIVANLVAVPVVTLVVVPTSIVGAALTTFGAGWARAVAAHVLAAADGALHLLMGWLEAMAGAPQAWVTHIAVEAASLYRLVPWLAMGAVLIAIATPLRGLLWPAAAVWLSLLLPPGVRVPQGHVEVWALDVGQGAAVLVRTRSSVLLFDAGPRFPGGHDLGEAVVVPALRSLGIRRIDRLILSHGDADHAGGASAVSAALGPSTVLAGADVDDAAGQACEAGQRWVRDDVVFEIVHPSPGWRGARRGRDHRNDGSCVLVIAAAGKRVLLTGDIGARVEFDLPIPPGVDLLLVPHHGSTTSSSKRFVALTRPAHAVVQAGRFSRFGHPSPRVVARYRAVGSAVHVTGTAGAIVYRSWVPDGQHRVLGWRDRMPAVWRVAPR